MYLDASFPWLRPWRNGDIITPLHSFRLYVYIYIYIQRPNKTASCKSLLSFPVRIIYLMGIYLAKFQYSNTHRPISLQIYSGCTPLGKPTWQWKNNHEWRYISSSKLGDFPFSPYNTPSKSTMEPKITHNWQRKWSEANLHGGLAGFQPFIFQPFPQLRSPNPANPVGLEPLLKRPVDGGKASRRYQSSIIYFYSILTYIFHTIHETIVYLPTFGRFLW